MASEGDQKSPDAALKDEPLALATAPEPEPPTLSIEPVASAAETAPDPDEDDLDELDDMLDEFSINSKPAPSSITTAAPPSAPTLASTETKNPTTSPPPSSSGPGRPPTERSVSAPSTTDPIASALADVDEDAFARQLQEGMADMLRELEQNPDMARQFQEMMESLGGTAPEIPLHPGPALATDAESNARGSEAVKESSAKADDAFQDTIRRTMERMRASNSAADAASRTGPAEDDIMASLLRELGAGGEGGEGADRDDNFSKMLMGMMEQLTNKEILYEPMKELDTKFPEWLESNKDKVSKEDRERYESQSDAVREIVGRFERVGYSDSNVEDREFVVEKMQQLQAAGAPPADLVGDMGAAQEALGDLESGCAQQ